MPDRDVLCRQPVRAIKRKRPKQALFNGHLHSGVVFDATHHCHKSADLGEVAFRKCVGNHAFALFDVNVSLQPGSFKQRCQRQLRPRGNPLNDENTDILHAAFHGAHIGTIHVTEMSKLLLRQAYLLASYADRLAQSNQSRITRMGWRRSRHGQIVTVCVRSHHG